MIRSIYLILLTFFIFCISCNPFAPSLTDDIGGGGILTDQGTPDDVLTNFEIAYNTKNIVAYGDLIDSNFIFISKDFSTNPVTDLTWGRDDELKTTEGLFNGFDIVRLSWNTTIDTNTLSDTQFEIRQSFLLTLGSGIDIPTFSGEALFIMVKMKSGKWKILRWEDGNLI